MLKQLIIFPLMLSYLAGVSGILLNIHYCGGEISSVTWNAAGKDPCACRDGEQKKGCCTDDVLFYKIAGEHETGSPVSIPVSALPPEAASYGGLYFPEHKLIRAVYPSTCSDLPPPDRLAAFCTWLI